MSDQSKMESISTSYGLVMGRVPVDQAGRSYYYLWEEWLRELVNEAWRSDGREYGDLDYEVKMVVQAQHCQESQEMMASCAQCREFEGLMVYPSHVPKVQDHVEHCSCEKCF